MSKAPEFSDIDMDKSRSIMPVFEDNPACVGVCEDCEVDVCPPDIILNLVRWQQAITVECGRPYKDPGARAVDCCDGVINVVTDASEVDIHEPGDYTVTYTATDAAGNTATKQRAVTVEDRFPPHIHFDGEAVSGTITESIECGAPYNAPVVTALDSCEGDITDRIFAVGDPVESTTPGTYVITYTVMDSSGNTAPPVTHRVIVEDTECPVITLNGEAEVTVECGARYTDSGATADDACDGDLTAQIHKEGAVDTAVVGTYTITYTVQDLAGNAAEETRTVEVVDTQAPTIYLTGEKKVECGEPYIPPLVRVYDFCDGIIETVTITGDTVQTTVPGDYTVLYTATDAAGNEATEEWNVQVEDTLPPEITVSGSTSVTVECGSSYTDAGAHALDLCNGDLSGNIATSGTVDTNAPGDYTITYTVTDCAGHTAAAQRTVTVCLTTIISFVYFHMIFRCFMAT